MAVLIYSLPLTHIAFASFNW